jgi:anti-sigma regulatory factor (Ser/Thr protein kinase)
VLYTDGLVEDRQRDIDDGLNFLRDVFKGEAARSSLNDLCRAALAGVYAHQQRDDIAILIARLSKIPADHHVAWTLPAELISAWQARCLIREPLQRWGLSELMPTTELLVSELVTNAIRHATGEVTLRIVLEGSLVCEVLDGSAALPRLRHAGRDEECGRGLEVVSQLAQRWGARRTPQGKIVWCEQALPSAPAGPPPEETAANTSGEMTANTSGEMTAEAPAETTAQPPAETTAQPPAETTAQPPAETTAQPPAETTAQPPAKTPPDGPPAKTPGKTTAEAEAPADSPPAEATAKTPGDTPAGSRPRRRRRRRTARRRQAPGPTPAGSPPEEATADAPRPATAEPAGSPSD